MTTVPKDRSRHLYVIAFTSGTVKVGRAINVAARLTDHRSVAAAHGIQPTRTWTSEPHSNFEETEQALIAFCSSRWPAEGREYFRDADFDSIAEFAASLPFDVTVGPGVGQVRREARAERKRQLDALEAAATRFADRPGAEWPSGLLGIARMGLTPLPKDFPVGDIFGGES